MESDVRDVQQETTDVQQAASIQKTANVQEVADIQETPEIILVSYMIILLLI